MKNITKNILQLFSCQKYSHLCSKGMDCNLSFSEKIKHRFHHLICFTCRRFSKQLNAIDAGCHALNPDEHLKHKCLSPETKNKIKSAIELEKNL